MFWCALVCFGVFWLALNVFNGCMCLGVLWGALVCIGGLWVFWLALKCFGWLWVFLCALVCFGVFCWAFGVFNGFGMFWVAFCVLVCFGVFGCVRACVVALHPSGTGCASRHMREPGALRHAGTVDPSAVR